MGQGDREAVDGYRVGGQTASDFIVGAGIAVTIIAGLHAAWQLRPSVQRYVGTYAGEIEWKRLQDDQRRTTLLVVGGLGLQLLGLILG